MRFQNIVTYEAVFMEDERLLIRTITSLFKDLHYPRIINFVKPDEVVVLGAP